MSVSATHPVFIVVMGVSGAGKSTLAENVASALNLPVRDGDQFHPKTNIDKMARGVALTDADREPWLRLIRQVALQIIDAQLAGDTTAAEEADAPPSKKLRGVVISCSALKRYYRDILRGRPLIGPPTKLPLQEDDSTVSSLATDIKTFFVFVHGPEDELLTRMRTRQGHFMKADMLKSQLATLEDPTLTGENDVVAVNLLSTPAEQVAAAVRGLNILGLGSV